jgi:hypothetical protein
MVVNIAPTAGVPARDARLSPRQRGSHLRLIPVPMLPFTVLRRHIAAYAIDWMFTRLDVSVRAIRA